MNSLSLILNGAQFGQVCDTLCDEWGDEDEVEPLRFSQLESHGAVKKAVDEAIKPYAATDDEIGTLQGVVRQYYEQDKYCPCQPGEKLKKGLLKNDFGFRQFFHK